MTDSEKKALTDQVAALSVFEYTVAVARIFEYVFAEGGRKKDKAKAATPTGMLHAPQQQPNVYSFALLGAALTAPAYMVTGEFFTILAVKLEVTTGALGWIGPDGAMQTSILIRTFVADGRRLSLHVGGGITWGSDPDREWDETVAKASGPLGAIGGDESPS